MSRVLLLIAVLFTFASVGGASASYADGRIGSHGIFGAIANVSDECVAEETARVVQYKPCTKKLNGIAIPCPHQPSVLPMALAFSPVPTGRMERLVPATSRFGDGPGLEGQFRPPRG